MSDKPTTESPLFRRIWRIAWKSVMWFFILTISWVVIYKWINPPTTFLQLTTSCPEGVKIHKKWIDGDEISLYMKLAVVASEDNNFMKHNGIDWGAVEKAKKYNETVGKAKGKYRGASTITQQTVKNVFLWPGKSKSSKWIRKGFEFYFTYLVEWIWGKDRIMEVYLNVIETGRCKFGVEAAAQDYFHTSASKLSKEQSALIAACLPNPNKYSVTRPGPYMKRRQRQIALLMRMIGESYFSRYGSDVPRTERIKQEQEIEKKIESLPDAGLQEVDSDDIPESSLDEETKPDNPQETDTPDEEPAADSSSVLP